MAPPNAIGAVAHAVVRLACTFAGVDLPIAAFFRQAVGSPRNCTQGQVLRPSKDTHECGQRLSARWPPVGFAGRITNGEADLRSPVPRIDALAALLLQGGARRGHSSLGTVAPPGI